MAELKTKITGGAKLEAALAKMSSNLKRAATLRVGFLEGSTYPDGTSVPLVAALNEFGHGKTPPRPFFRNMVAAKSPGWPAAIAPILKAADYDAHKALETVGEGIKGQLQESIIATNEPALSPITVMLRGMKANDSSLIVTGRTVGEAAARVAAGKTNYGASTKPLVDTGVLLAAADFEVS